MFENRVVEMKEQARKRLEEERERLIKELSRRRALRLAQDRGVETKGYGEERTEDAIKTIELEKGLALEENLRRLLYEVEHALDKFAQGTYGLCDECGQPIAPERLEALPHANLCIACKARQMKNAKGKYPR